MLFTRYRVIQVGPLHDKEKAKLVVSLADDDERIRQVNSCVIDHLTNHH